jgi:hypothetical protein
MKLFIAGGAAPRRLSRFAGSIRAQRETLRRTIPRHVRATPALRATLECGRGAF